jgi:hypothetical protein
MTARLNIHAERFAYAAVLAALLTATVLEVSRHGGLGAAIAGGVGPAALVAVAAAGPLGHAWLVGGLAWGAHVALDRAVGYGLRTREGFQRSGR